MTTPTEQQNCPVLHLELGPLDLDLLGLRVQLNQVVVDIDAIPEPGNLLGNLLSAVAHLLDGVALGALLEGLLDNVLAALTRLLEGIGGGITSPGLAGGGIVPSPAAVPAA